MDDSPYKYLCDLMCLPQGFSKGQDSYLCFRLFFVEKTDLKKLSRNNLKGYDVFFFFHYFFATRAQCLLNKFVTQYTEQILFLYFCYIL